MANWCNNIVSFDGDEVKREAAFRFFEQLGERYDKEQKGQLPDFIQGDEGYFFAPHWEDETLYYETRWSPNTATLLQVANHFDVGFTYEYEELGNGIYGEATYDGKQLLVTQLDDADLDAYEYVEEQDQYQFEGKAYETDYEIIDILMERKRKEHPLTAVKQ